MKKSKRLYDEFKMFYGKRVLKKYRCIEPFLYLVYYRCKTWSEGIYNGDMDVKFFSMEGLKSIVKFPIFYLNYILMTKKSINQSNKTIVLSRTTADIDRFSDNLKEISRRYNVLVPITSSYFSVRKRQKREGSLYHPLYFPFGITGFLIKKHVKYIMKYVKQKIGRKEVFKYDSYKGRFLLSFFNFLIKRRTKKIAQVFKKRRVSCFATINQYNMADYLCIKACHEIGVKSKEMTHAAFCIVPAIYYDYVTYVDERCVWSEAEKSFCEKYCKGISFAGNTDIVVAGSPEINYQSLVKKKRLYKKDESLLLLIISPSEILKTDNEKYNNDEKKKIYDYRKRVNEQIYYLGKKYGLKIYAKYHPAEYEMFYQSEKDMMKQYNIEVLENSAEALSRKLCECKYVFGSSSTALVLSLAYGCNVYNVVRNMDDKYEYSDLEITNVTSDNISKVDLLDIQNVNEEKYERELSLNIGKLFK